MQSMALHNSSIASLIYSRTIAENLIFFNLSIKESFC